MIRCLVPILLLPVIATADVVGNLPPDPFADASGRALMEAVYERHQQYPYVFEQQSMIMIDARGNTNTRKLRRYSRVNADGLANFLLLFDSPIDVKGVALLAAREPDGNARQSFYLPAFGGTFIETDASYEGQSEENFLGTDFSIEDLVGEMLDMHRYVRLEDVILEDTWFYVVNVYGPNVPEDLTPKRRHYIRKDNLFISRTDHFDELGRVQKRQTHHDLTNVHGDMWRANMMMMDNLHQNHRTIIKIDDRVFSADYVPENAFTQEWILANQAPLDSLEEGEDD